MLFFMLFLLIFCPCYAEKIFLGHKELEAISFLERRGLATDAFLFLEAAPKKMDFCVKSNRLYVLCSESSLIYCIDTQEQTLEKTIDLKENLCDFFFHDNCIFVTSLEHFFVYSLEKQRVVWKVPHCLEGNLQLALSNDANWVFITGNNGCLQTIYLKNKQCAKVSINKGDLNAICAVPNSTCMLIASSSYDHDLILWDYAKKEKSRVLSLVRFVEGGNDLVFSFDKKYLYVLGEQTSNVGKIYWEKKQLVGSLPVGFASTSFSITKNGQALFVSSAQEKTLSVIDLATFSLEQERTFIFPCTCVFVQPATSISGLKATQVVQKFLSANEYKNVLEWSCDPGLDIAYYLVKKNGRFFRKVFPSRFMQVEDTRIKKGQVVVYTVIGVTTNGTYEQRHQITCGVKDKPNRLLSALLDN